MNRAALAAGLLAGAGLWVAALSLTAGRPGGGAAAPPAAAGGSRAQAATVKFVDLAGFKAGGEVTVRLDILDAAGKPITDLKREQITVTEEGLPGRVKSFKGPASQAINLLFVIDVSGSMVEDNRMAGAKRAARAALDTLTTDRDRVGLIAFDERFDERVRFGPLTAAHRAACEQAIEKLRPRGGTVIGPPVLAAIRNVSRDRPDGMKVVLLLTDGEDGTPPPQFAKAREACGTQAAEFGVQVHTVSVGSGVAARGQSDLQDLATRGNGSYRHAPDAAELAELFRARVAETVNECTLVYESPYPEPDGVPRQFTIRIAAAGQPLTALGEYRVPGAVLGARAKPAAWAVAAGAGGAGGAPAAKSAAWVQVPVFLGLLAALGGGLAAPLLRRRGAAVAAPPASVPPTAPAAGGAAPRVPPPPPVPRPPPVPPAPRAAPAVAAPVAPPAVRPGGPPPPPPRPPAPPGGHRPPPPPPSPSRR